MHQTSPIAGVAHAVSQILGGPRVPVGILGGQQKYWVGHLSSIHLKMSGGPRPHALPPLSQGLEPWWTLNLIPIGAAVRVVGLHVGH
jgi:hypothetical protein